MITLTYQVILGPIYPEHVSNPLSIGTEKKMAIYSEL